MHLLLLFKDRPQAGIFFSLSQPVTDPRNFFPACFRRYVISCVPCQRRCRRRRRRHRRRRRRRRLMLSMIGASLMNAVDLD